MAEVDALLDRVAAQLEARDTDAPNAPMGDTRHES
jgi:hypothetical protein